MDKIVRNLACAVLIQAAKDYCQSQDAKIRAKILKDLRSNWMETLTEGTSIVIAEQLELHPKEIAERLRQNYESLV